MLAEAEGAKEEEEGDPDPGAAAYPEEDSAYEGGGAFSSRWGRGSFASLMPVIIALSRSFALWALVVYGGTRGF